MQIAFGLMCAAGAGAGVRLAGDHFIDMAPLEGMSP